MPYQSKITYTPGDVLLERAENTLTSMFPWTQKWRTRHAEKLFRRALQEFEDTKDLEGQAQVHQRIADILSAQKPNIRIAHYTIAGELYKQIADNYGRKHSLSTFQQLVIDTYGRAIECFEKCDASRADECAEICQEYCQKNNIPI